MTKNFCLIGHSGSGKDTTAGMMSLATQGALKYAGSLSKFALPELSRALKLSPAETYTRRHEFAKVFQEKCNQLREQDPTRLVRRALAHGNFVTGVRSQREFTASKTAGLFDLVVWVEREVFYDATLELTMGDADVVLPNTDTPLNLYRRVENLFLFSRLIPKRVFQPDLTAVERILTQGQYVP